MSLRLPYPRNGPFQQLKNLLFTSLDIEGQAFTPIFEMSPKMFHRFRVIKVQRLKILRALATFKCLGYFWHILDTYFFQNDEFFFAIWKTNLTILMIWAYEDIGHEFESCASSFLFFLKFYLKIFYALISISKFFTVATVYFYFCQTRKKTIFIEILF